MVYLYGYFSHWILMDVDGLVKCSVAINIKNISVQIGK